MVIRTVRPEEYGDFIAFLNAGMRPKSASTRADEDFPVVLSPENLAGMWGCRDERGWLTGLTVLTRTFTTTAGEVRVAGIGSVVTRPDRRGQGLSGRLQAHVMSWLADQEVPLAVLWSDQPEIYSGRGFLAAGWEYHVDLTAARLDDALHGTGEIRPYQERDLADVSRLYAQHPLRTLRRPGDDARLYGMCGTRGLVLETSRGLAAYAFCGKGEDFPGYVAEWGGPAHLVLPVLAVARDRGLAQRVLVPAGRGDLVAAAVRKGAGVDLWPSGLWAVLRQDILARLAPAAENSTAGDSADPRTWLGSPGTGDRPVVGRLNLAVWGFDSV